ncbi:Nuclear factor 7, ovary [Liparis tanakae]|uniref:Nuclear factor 7, ovary n=1 Tax=Liparis tanakae TaxID=230148 RepID=A0A4Z2E738_9TELE|nr:Nuclear factor 7, ovary [Liparis tanakae]
MAFRSKEDQETLEHIHVQARRTERQIEDQFKKLHQFLEEEEEARKAALREEENQKCLMVKGKMEALGGEIEALSDTVREPEDEPSALIDEAEHVGNLAFRICSKMKDLVSYTPLVLDPNTVNPNLVLSEDLTSVEQGSRELTLPDNTERFDEHWSIAGSEGLVSGTHSWDVDVGDSTDWKMGVTPESVARKKRQQVKIWRLGLYCNKLFAASPTGQDELAPLVTPRRIRMVLDQTRGTLSFSNLDTEEHIYTFTHDFTGRVLPKFCSVLKLKILTQSVYVTTGELRGPEAPEPRGPGTPTGP